VSNARSIITGLLAVMEDLSQQQAMTDDWWRTHPALIEARGYLGEPVHIGDAITIKLVAAYEDELPREDVPEGLQVTAHPQTFTGPDGEEHDSTYNTYVMPEGGPARYVNSKQWSELGGAFVVAINGRNYRVDVHIDHSEYGCEGGAVTFTRTEESETALPLWEHDVAVAEWRARYVEDLEEYRKTLANAEEAYNDPRQISDYHSKETRESIEWIQDDIQRAEQEIAACDTGDIQLRHPGYAQVFGQPHWLQAEVHPAHNGRCAMALVSMDTGWGDSGNVNILFACDDDGIPCRVWFESSCA